MGQLAAGAIMTRFITHSDNWNWRPPIPDRFYRGWWIEGEDGSMDGPFKTEAEAQEELEEELA